MYKKVFSISGESISPRVKALIKMKLTLAFIFALNMTVLASFGQRITLSESQSSLNNVLKKIQKQTSYDFMISSSLLQLARPVNITVNNAKIEDVLLQLFEGQPLEYEIVNNAVLVTRKKDVKEDITTVPVVINQQQIVGRVVDQHNRGIAGVTIVIKGETKAITSDAQGYFVLPIAANRQTIQLTSIGYNRHEVVAADKMVIKLTAKSNEIDEVVSVGYGTAKRKDLTGSVASVDVDEVKNAPFVSIDQALAGKAAGVQVVQADGSPGGVAKIRIRGGASLIGGNDPLYIIDGIQVPIQNRYIEAAADITNPVEYLGADEGYSGSAVGSSFGRGMNTLAGLNINDIESIDILKDASATAIYGSRAANGVVIITTKKGKHNQKPLFEANYYSAFSQAITEKVLDREQYINLMTIAARNHVDHYTLIGRPINANAQAILDNPDFFGNANTNWMDEVTRTGITQNVDLSVRGGGTGSRYYTSLAYQDQKGVLKGTDFKRLSGKINLDNEITDKFRFITNLDFGHTINNITNGIYGSALLAPPTEAAYTEDGRHRQFVNANFGTSAFSGIQNPLLMLNGLNRSRSNTLLGSVAIEYDILKNLKFRSSASINYNAYNQENYIPSTVHITGNSTTSTEGGIATKGNTNQYDGFFENTLTWDKQFNENNRINVMAGTSWQKSSSKMFSASGQGFPDDFVLNGLSSAALALLPKQTDLQNSLLSFYLRANYALKERYLLTLTGRSDESSKFPKSNRVGYFPSFGVAWRMKEEKFMQNVDWVNELKIRASAGSTGTQNIGDNMFYTLFTPGSYAGSNALRPTQMGNDNIKWETTYQKDAGLDFEMFNRRLRGAFGYYSKHSKDLLMAIPIATSSGFASSLVNFADISNKGLEFDLRGDVIRNRNFQWNIAGNISFNRSKVNSIKMDTQDPKNLGETDPFNRETFTLGNTIIREGEPVGLIFGYHYLGTLKSQQEVDDYVSRNLYLSYGVFGKPGLGDPSFELVEEGPYQGFIKKDIIGRAEPKYFGGITNTFSYKNLSLLTLFTYSVGGDLLYMPEMRNLSMADRANRTTAALDYYSAANPTSERTRPILSHPTFITGAATSYAVYDASYLKLKTLSINYQIPNSVLSRCNVNNASIYFSVNNLFVITKYPGADPETSNDPYSLINGYTDSANYPTMRQFSFGLRFGF